MRKLPNEQFEHAMNHEVFLDSGKKGHQGHLMCGCAGKRLKDCPKICGGSRCHHRIEKGTNTGSYTKKSTCPECSPEKFCEHHKRRDKKCNGKRKKWKKSGSKDFNKEIDKTGKHSRVVNVRDIDSTVAWRDTGRSPSGTQYGGSRLLHLGSAVALGVLLAHCVSFE